MNNHHHTNHGNGSRPGAACHHDHSTHTPAAAGQHIDPVCGMTVAADSSHHTTHAGHDYRFCSAGCRTKFIAEPLRYLAPSANAPGPLPVGTTYTCPMHPDVIRNEPGSCPVCGMALEPVMPGLDDGENPELVDFRRRFLWTLPLSLAVLVLAMFGGGTHVVSPAVRTWIELALSAPVVLWAGWPFFPRWWQSIANRSPNMWTLIGTGVGAAFIYSVVATLAPGLFPDSFREHGRVAIYFEAAAIIVSLTLLGQILELKARSSTSAASRRCWDLRRRPRVVFATDGTERRHSADHVHVGDQSARAPGGESPRGWRGA